MRLSCISCRRFLSICKPMWVLSVTALSWKILLMWWSIRSTAEPVDALCQSFLWSRKYWA